MEADHEEGQAGLYCRACGVRVLLRVPRANGGEVTVRGLASPRRTRSDQLDPMMVTLVSSSQSSYRRPTHSALVTVHAGAHTSEPRVYVIHSNPTTARRRCEHGLWRRVGACVLC